ncbi:MAG TPA: sugar ABC transporter substrate-binding protein [Xanthobacteraceae bacterium]|nr:sugar ABC transporter substrate-binding protein [Xanthobacteraceae bacterium]
MAVLLALTVLGPPRAMAATIAVFTKNQNSPIFAALRAGAGVAAKNLGVEVVHYVPSTPDNVAEQNKLVDDAIKDKPDAIVFVPIDAAQATGAVAEINAANIPLINVNERLPAGNIAGYVGTDDVALAQETGRYLIKALGGKGNVAILDGPDSNLTAQGRAKGFRDAIKDAPDIKLLAGKSANYARAQGKQVTGEFLRSFAQLDGILAANDPMAIGAVDALKAAGRKSLVVGINASREAMDLIKSGDTIGSGDYDTFVQGCIGVELAVRAIKKESAPLEVMLKPLVIDKTNYGPFDQPFEKRACPTLQGVAGQ